MLLGLLFWRVGILVRSVRRIFRLCRTTSQAYKGFYLMLDLSAGRRVVSAGRILFRGRLGSVRLTSCDYLSNLAFTSYFGRRHSSVRALYMNYFTCNGKGFQVVGRFFVPYLCVFSCVNGLFYYYLGGLQMLGRGIVLRSVSLVIVKYLWRLWSLSVVIGLRLFLSWEVTYNGHFGLYVKGYYLVSVLATSTCDLTYRSLASRSLLVFGGQPIMYVGDSFNSVSVSYRLFVFITLPSTSSFPLFGKT